MSDEVVTKAVTRLIHVPGLAKPVALITLDNGFDHTKPNTFGKAGTRPSRPPPRPTRPRSR